MFPLLRKKAIHSCITKVKNFKNKSLKFSVKSEITKLGIVPFQKRVLLVTNIGLTAENIAVVTH